MILRIVLGYTVVAMPSWLSLAMWREVDGHFPFSCSSHRLWTVQHLKKIRHGYCLVLHCRWRACNTSVRIAFSCHCKRTSFSDLDEANSCLIILKLFLIPAVAYYYSSIICTSLFECVAPLLNGVCTYAIGLSFLLSSLGPSVLVTYSGVLHALYKSDLLTIVFQYSQWVCGCNLHNFQLNNWEDCVS